MTDRASIVERAHSITKAEMTRLAVDQTWVNRDTLVSTVFLWVRRLQGLSDMWETMVFHNDKPVEKYERRYASRDDAMAGHRETVELIRAGN